MSNSNSKKKRAKKAKKQELKERSFRAYRRRAGLAPDQEETELASYLRRFFAFLIDQVAYMFFFFFYSTLLVILIGPDLALKYSATTSIFVFGAIYFVPSIARKGQTYGLKKAGIMVIHKSGEQFLDYFHSGIRWFVSLGLPYLVSTLVFYVSPGNYGPLVSGVVYLATMAGIYIPILKTPDRQGVHDAFASSFVVKQLKPKIESKKAI